MDTETSAMDIIRRLDNAKLAIIALDRGKKEVVLDDLYKVKVSEQSFVFYKRMGLNNFYHHITTVPRFSEHKTSSGRYKHDNEYINMISMYLSLPV